MRLVSVDDGQSISKQYIYLSGSCYGSFLIALLYPERVFSGGCGVGPGLYQL